MNEDCKHVYAGAVARIIYLSLNIFLNEFGQLTIEPHKSNYQNQ